MEASRGKAPDLPFLVCQAPVTLLEVGEPDLLLAAQRLQEINDFRVCHAFRLQPVNQAANLCCCHLFHVLPPF